MRVPSKYSKFFRGADLRSRILRGGAASIFIKGIALLISFLLAIVLARTMGPTNYGTYAFALTLVTLLGVPAQAGLPTLVTRETAKAFLQADWALMKGLWLWSARLVLGMSLAIAALLFVGLSIYGELVSPERRAALLIALGVVPLAALGNLRGAALRGLRKPGAGLLPEYILRPLFLLVFVAVLVDPDSPVALTADVVLKYHVLAVGFSFLIGVCLLQYLRPPPLKTQISNRFEVSNWRRASYSLVMISALQLLNTNVDIIFIGLTLTDTDVGHYRVATQLAGLVIFGLTAINLVIHPYIASLYAERAMDKLQKLATKSALVILLLAIPPVTAFVLAGPWILENFFGEAYSAAYLPLAILCIGQLANAAMGSVGALLNMTGHEKDTMKGMAIAFTVNIVLNSLLVPLFGINGAATSTSISLLVWNILLWNAVKKRLGIKSTAFQVI